MALRMCIHTYTSQLQAVQSSISLSPSRTLSDVNMLLLLGCFCQGNDIEVDLARVSSHEAAHNLGRVLGRDGEVGLGM